MSGLEICLDCGIGWVCLITWLEWKFGWIRDLAGSHIWLDLHLVGLEIWIGLVRMVIWLGWTGLDGGFDWVGDSVLLEVGDLAVMYFWFYW